VGFPRTGVADLTQRADGQSAFFIILSLESSKERLHGR
jgi:hypothetical protein